MSGVLRGAQAERVVTALCPFFRDVRVAAEEGDWALVTATRRSDAPARSSSSE